MGHRKNTSMGITASVSSWISDIKESLQRWKLPSDPLPDEYAIDILVLGDDVNDTKIAIGRLLGMTFEDANRYQSCISVCDTRKTTLTLSNDCINCENMPNVVVSLVQIMQRKLTQSITQKYDIVVHCYNATKDDPVSIVEGTIKAQSENQRWNHVMHVLLAIYDETHWTEGIFDAAKQKCNERAWLFIEMDPVTDECEIIRDDLLKIINNAIDFWHPEGLTGFWDRYTPDGHTQYQYIST